MKPALRNTARCLKTQIDGNPDLSAELDAYVKAGTSIVLQSTLSPVVTAYLLVSWVLEANSPSNGFGFPFDQPHLVFYQRLQHAFAKPIVVNTPAGPIIIQPQRTNNLLEQSFRFMKCGRRKKSGQHSLSKALVGMFADTLLVRNLKNADYMDILLKGANNLAERFADIDAKEVLREERENKGCVDKYPRNIRRLFKLPNLPEILMKAA